MAPPRRFAIGAPDYLAVLDPTGKPLAFRRPARVDVIGGRVYPPPRNKLYRPGDTMDSGRFSLGVERPAEVRVTNEDGESAAIANPQRLVFLGEGVDLTHTPPPAPPDPQLRPRPMLREVTSLLSQLVDNPNPTGHREVDDVDDQTAHIVDNGASLEMADRTASAPDDFDDLVRKRGEALKAAGGDDLAAGALLQDGHQSELQKQAPWVRANPPSSLRGILGSSVTLQVPLRTVALDDVINSAPTVAYWQGDDAETTCVTVTLGATTPARRLFSLVPASIRPFAKVSFGTRSYLTSVLVDISNGTQFTVSGSQVTVQVALEPGTQTGVGADQPSFTLFGMLSFQQVIRTVPLVRTISVDTGGGVQVVPPFASRMWFIKDTLANAVTVTIADAYNNALYQFTSAANVQMTEPIPLSDDAVCVNVLGGATGKLIFELSL